MCFFFVVVVESTQFSTCHIFLFAVLDGYVTEEVDSWGNAFAHGGFRGIPPRHY
jgi:hypothetical protein